METKTSESWVRAEEGTLHFIESESTTTRSRPGSADASPQITEPEDIHPRKSSGHQSNGGSANHDSAEVRDQKSLVTDDDKAVTDLEHLQPPPHCQLQRKSTVLPDQEPPT